MLTGSNISLERTTLRGKRGDVKDFLVVGWYVYVEVGVMPDLPQAAGNRSLKANRAGRTGRSGHRRPEARTAGGSRAPTE